MIHFDPPIPLPDSALTVTAHDGASYVLSDGRTLWSPAPDDLASPEAIAVEVASLLANPNPAPVVPAPVPAEVPMWALRAILDLAGLTAQIDTILAQLPEPDKTIVLRVWEYGNYLRRDSPTIESLRQALGKTPAEVDGYFVAAAALNP